MFDKYLILYIQSFLKLCIGCKKYDVLQSNRCCCICKKYYCYRCKYSLRLNYDNYETMSNYCNDCNRMYF